MLELMPLKQQVFVGSFMCIVDGFTMVSVSLVFAFATTYWRPFQYYNVIISITFSFLVLWLPESPRFFHSHKRFDEARQIFTRMGRCNKVLKAEEHYE
jgi:hypothetical protein